MDDGEPTERRAVAAVITAPARQAGTAASSPVVRVAWRALRTARQWLCLSHPAFGQQPGQDALHRGPGTYDCAKYEPQMMLAPASTGTATCVMR
ncbi:hypothetical protein GCM10022255_088950 [Dactylosporangium darangshiense]|uniref:Uncharacterized protein n=1 Tax=Dactylosporangium darangshiense TaxID=579108 RepID=A0ABP8DNN2_9ACTN